MQDIWAKTARPQLQRISHLALLLIAWASSSTRYCHFMRWKYLTSCTIWTGHNNPLAMYITKLNERHEMLIVMRHLCTALSTRRYLNALCNTLHGGLWPDCLRQFRSPDHNTRSYIPYSLQEGCQFFNTSCYPV